MPDKRIVTFPWGIDLDHFSPRVNSTTAPEGDNQVREGTFTLLSTRSWEPIYGVDIIVQAYIQVSQTQPGIRLVMLGNGSLATDLRQRFLDAGLYPSPANLNSAKDARVIFPGQVGFSNLPESYRSSDLYLSASHSDGTSISLLEAMACGLPVLVSDIPGNREWVVPGVNGWLFTDRNPSALASAILEAFNDRNRLIEMGKNARKSVEGRADWKANFQKMLKAYELVVNEN
jgi:glycosyltransferase involved in cell wall biosynthesis